jgi:REP element-mobilizing transposase RayT
MWQQHPRRRRRRLPHLYLPGQIHFLTWRLAGSLPAGRCFDTASASAGKAFAVLDRLLDSGKYGPTFLREPVIAGIVASELAAAFDGGSGLLAWVVMPNHVHAVAVAPENLAVALQAVKGRSARLCNLALGLTGQPFWQAECFDRWVRSPEELERVVRYVERNPVRAGLVRDPADFRWSSAFGRAGAGLKSRAG